MDQACRSTIRRRTCYQKVDSHISDDTFYNFFKICGGFVCNEFVLFFSLLPLTDYLYISFLTDINTKHSIVFFLIITFRAII